MLFVDRSRVPPPSYLSSPEVAHDRQLFLEYLRLDEKERAQTRVPDRHLREHVSIREALATLFHGKCAFCESRTPTSLYRFRPTSDAHPLDSRNTMAHLAYGWLADAWQNLYPICSGCRPRDLAYFPVLGDRAKAPSVVEYSVYVSRKDGLWPFTIAETPVLLDPCYNQDIADHIVLQDDGTVFGETRMGEITIEHFNLNRPDLVEMRRYDILPGFLGLKTVDANRQFAGLLGFRPDSLPTPTAPSPYPASSPDPEKLASPGPIVGPDMVPPLTRISLRNFKAIEKLDLDLPPAPENTSETPNLAQAVLILGENASGKSSILEAIALVLLDDKARSALGEKPAKYLLDPSHMGVDGVLPRAEGEVSLTFGDGSVRALHLTPKDFRSTGADARQPVFAYGAYRHFLDKTKDWSPERPVVTLFRSDDLMSNPQTWLLSLDEGRFDMVVQVLRDIFGTVQTFKVIDRDLERQVCYVVKDIGGGQRRRTPLASVSSGFRTILALSCDIMRWAMDKKVNPGFNSLTAFRGIVLIDEVEAHLHPQWKIHIMQGLRRALPAMTFIASTHDPLCLRGMRNGEVKVLHSAPGRALGSDLPVMVEVLSDLPNVTQLTIEQLLTSDLFSLFSTDDRRTEIDLARLADAVTAIRSGKAPPDKALWDAWRDDINSVLPIGHGEAARLVQEAVAEYLVDRAKANASDRKTLRDKARRLIVQALEGL